MDKMLLEYMDYFHEVSGANKMTNKSKNMFNSIIYYAKDTRYDKNREKEFRKHVKNETKMFSPFRSEVVDWVNHLILSNSDTPTADFEDISLIYEKLHAKGFKESYYLVVAATAMFYNCDSKKYDDVIDKAYEIYQSIKKKHPFLTSPDDYPLSVIMAGTEKSVDKIVEDVEYCYNYLHDGGFCKSNGLQLLSHIMSLTDESNKIKCERAIQIQNTLKSEGFSLLSEYYGIIGLFSLLEINNHSMIIRLADFATEMMKSKEFKWQPKGLVLLVASMLILKKQLLDDENKEMIAVALDIVVRIQYMLYVSTSSATYVASTT